MENLARVYRPKTRVGNWFEDLYLENVKIDGFQRKRLSNSLLIEKTRRLFDTFHQRVDLEAPKENIRFGAIVQLMPLRMDICEEKNIDLKPALSVNISANAVQNAERINEDCELSIAPSKSTFVRNSFRIMNIDDRDRSKEFLRYGQQFRLECVEGDDRTDPLVIYATPKACDLSTIIRTTHLSMKRGEVNIPCGLVRMSKCGPGKDIPLGHTTWICKNINPHHAFESFDQPLPSNSELVISHMATNKNLAAENIQIPTLFGPEYLVSVQEYKDIYHRYEWKNCWMICNGQ